MSPQIDYKLLEGRESILYAFFLSLKDQMQYNAHSLQVSSALPLSDKKLLTHGILASYGDFDVSSPTSHSV